MNKRINEFIKYLSDNINMYEFNKIKNIIYIELMNINDISDIIKYASDEFSSDEIEIKLISLTEYEIKFNQG